VRINARPTLRIVTRWPKPRQERGILTLLCPCLAGLPPDRAAWLGILPLHDANARLLAIVRELGGQGGAQGGMSGDVFAGVLAIDPFRSVADLLAALRAGGVRGVVNLPSVAAFDGEMGAILDDLRFGMAREIDFLAAAVASGFRAAGCARSPETAQRMVEAGVELIIADGGPPLAGQRRRRAAAVARIARSVRTVPVVALPDRVDDG
jgi:predicted TIM-barrel enzyme